MTYIAVLHARLATSIPNHHMEDTDTSRPAQQYISMLRAEHIKSGIPLHTEGLLFLSSHIWITALIPHQRRTMGTTNSRIPHNPGTSTFAIAGTLNLVDFANGIYYTMHLSVALPWGVEG